MKEIYFNDGIVDEMAYNPEMDAVFKEILESKKSGMALVEDDKVAMIFYGNPVKWEQPEIALRMTQPDTLDTLGVAISVNGQDIPAHEIHRYVDFDKQLIKTPADQIPRVGGVTVDAQFKLPVQKKFGKPKPHWAALNEKKRRHRF